MDDRPYWEKKWQDYKKREVSDFAKKVLKHIKYTNSKTLLDLGSGSGEEAIYFARIGFDVVAIDYSNSGTNELKIAMKKTGIKTITPIREDITKFKFGNNKFDVVYAHLSLQYFDDKTTIILFDKIFESLKENGMFFVKCKSTDDPLFNVGKKIDEYTFIHNHIRHFFDEPYMSKLLKKFKIINIEKTSSKYHTMVSNFIEAIAKK